MSPAGNRFATAFTLIEVMMAIVIIAIVLALTYPSLSRGSASLKLRSAGRDVVNTMRYAREKAITEQKEMRVAVDRNTHKIMLTDEVGDDARTYSLPKEVRIHRMFQAGREVLDGPMVMRFLPNGSSDGAEVVLVSEKGSLLKVSSDPITGAARMTAAGEGVQP